MIKLVNVSKYYNSNNVIALGLRKVNLELHVNEFVAIVGESGSGKTTLLNVISGIDSYEDGEMYINGEETSYFSVVEMENYRKKYIAFVFQNYNLIDAYTVLQNVEAPLILSGYPKEKIRSRALEIIEKVGLTKHIHHKATKLSGGQKQRVVIARALAKDCPIIAADEPTGNLDSVSARQILELLHEISKEKLVIMVTHDFEQVKEFATRRIRIFDGEIVEDQDMVKVEKANLPVIPDEEKRIKFLEFVKMALRNLVSVPKKTLLMILVFSFFAFFVALSYGSFNVTMSDVSFNYNYYFQNTSISRMIVRKSDKTAFSQADIDELLALGKVQTVIPFDYLLDQSVSLVSEYDPNQPYDTLYLDCLLLPSSVLEDETVLFAGRMPRDDSEIVLALTSDRLENIDDYLNKTLFEGYYYDEGTASDQASYTVVGVVDVANIYMDLSNSYSGAYALFDDATFESMSYQAYFSYVSETSFVGIDNESQSVSFVGSLGYYPFMVDESVADNMLIMPEYFYEIECDSTTYCEATGTLAYADFYQETEIEDFTIRYGLYNLGNFDYKNSFIRVNSNTLESMIYDEIFQVSVISNTDLGVNTLVDDISKIDKTLLTAKYKVFYPFESNASDDFTGLLILLQTIGMIALLVVTVTGSTLITYVIFKAIINTKLHDYAIFRTIGANQNMIQYFIYLENLFVVMVSFALFIGVSVFLNANSNVGGIFYSLQGYTFVDYIVLFFLQLLMSLFISRKYCRRIFKESVNRVLKAE
ncbi:MAG: ABC transporter ATP-binding protein/permease [Firmicutes bacterium]|nr:ABC transporter ATP-binding protein/permease [Bacillota bacterium]